MSAVGTDQQCLKILCLHGYRQNAETFRGKTGALRKLLKKHINLVYISAPNKVKPLEENVDTDQRGWWFSTNEESFNSKEHGEVDPGFHESIQCITDAVNQYGPFDGILGFSQGASMVGMVLAMMEMGDTRFQFKFAIIVAGFKSRNTKHEQYYSKPIVCPTLHVYGDTDKIIPKEMSEDHLQYFENPQTLIHSGGHYVPATSAQKGPYIEFLQKRKEEMNGAGVS